MTQTYRIVAVLAEERGVLLAETCARCDTSKVGSVCPTCSLVFCHICWGQHIDSDARCTLDAINEAVRAATQKWQDFHAETARWRRRALP